MACSLYSAVFAASDYCSLRPSRGAHLDVRQCDRHRAAEADRLDNNQPARDAGTPFHQADPMSFGFQAAVFDMDGVITRTAGLHAAAWKELFDEFLRAREGDAYQPFDERLEYRTYVDGKPRIEG